MAKKIFVVTKPNLLMKRGEGSKRKMVKLPVGEEFECEEKEITHLLKKGRLTCPADDKAAEAKAKSEAKKEKK